MPDQASIFSNTNPPEPQAQPGGSNTPNVQIDPAIANLLGEIKNERGEPKYKTLQDALIGLKNAQEYIPQLNQKLTQKDEELASLRAAADRIAEIERTVQALTQPNSNTSTQAPAITEETIANLVTKSLSKAQQEAVQKANLTEVVSVMQQKFGAEAETTFYTKAKELGMSVEEFNALAAKTPKAVLKLLGVDTSVPANTASPTTSAVNTGGFQPTPQSTIGKNQKSILLGATSEQIRQESEAARKMVEELHASGKTVHDLTDPKVFFKTFA
jgi:uncharacterized protein with PIN domain